MRSGRVREIEILRYEESAATKEDDIDGEGGIRIYSRWQTPNDLNE